MKSLLTKRLPGILALALISLAVGAASGPAGAVASSGADASASSLTKKQRKAKRAALKKCNKKHRAKARRACKKRVNKRFRKLANQAPKGKTHPVQLGDNFFSPNELDIKVNDFVSWSWANIGGYEPHNVTLALGPAGVSRNDFVSPTTAVKSTRFKRQFTKPGTYDFVCNLHYEMTMTVKVTK